MTVENSKMLLAHYEKCKDDMNLTDQARLNAKHAYADMKANLAARGQPVEEKKSSSKK